MIQFTKSNSEFLLYGNYKHILCTCLSKSQYAISGSFTTTNTEHYIQFANSFKAHFHFNSFSNFLNNVFNVLYFHFRFNKEYHLNQRSISNHRIKF